MGPRQLLALAGLLMLWGSAAFAQDVSPRERVLEDRVVDTRLVLGLKRTYAAGWDPPAALDTTWLGHSYTDHFNATNNWWNLHTGEMLLTDASDPANAVWDWDHTTGLAAGDSLMGWWPVRLRYDMTGGRTLPDDQRPWWAIDIGNQANYVLNSGPGARRTKGVVGVWHADPGANAGSGVTWAPLSGQASAWCGLRQHGDNSVTDPITGNPFNQSVMEFNGTPRPSPKGGTATGYPGYASQWDQLLYRDFEPTPGQDVTITFLYRTRMSTGYDRAASTRTGWFHGDPLAVIAGNFISSTAAGANAPIDSFMVYVGVPVDDQECRYSDGLTRAVHDPMRRWFSEVIRIFDGPSVPYNEIFSVAGNHPADTLAATPTCTVVVPANSIDAIRTSPGNPTGRVRLVFRVKTNRGWDDESSATFTSVLYSSRGRGAAMIDDVQINGVLLGDFENSAGPGGIDNRSTVSPRDAWKSTGKPPGVYFHPHRVEDLAYDDECGAVNSPTRLCDLRGVVMAAGNHDVGEAIGDPTVLADREVMHGMLSPTINLVTNGAPNAMGITPEILDATDDWYIRYDVYSGIFDLGFTGCAWTIGVQSYPTKQWNGTKCWGPIRLPDFQLYNPRQQCFFDMERLFSNGLIVTSNENGIPDSIRLFIGVQQQCFRFGVSLGCSPMDGAYFDNVALAFVDAGPSAGSGNTPARQAIAVLDDQWFGDAFPFNRQAAPATPSVFDTTSAFITPELNIAPATGGLDRAYALGDSAVVLAPGESVRVDLVFRIRPGPGNFVVAGKHGTGLRRVPTSPAPATPGDGSYWGEYLASHDGNSGFGTPGGHLGGIWDPGVWNSARCDTAELRLFPVAARGNLTGLTPGLWASTYHEDDPKWNTLGVPRFQCFVLDTLTPATGANVGCDGSVPSWLTTVPGSRTGWDGATTTREFTKILPNGIFTPGTRIQYFYRKSRLDDPPGVCAMAPDTNLAWPQRSESWNFEPHRFAWVSVLPDRWNAAMHDSTLGLFGDIRGGLNFNWKFGQKDTWDLGLGIKALGGARDQVSPGGVTTNLEGVVQQEVRVGWLNGPAGGPDWSSASGLKFTAANEYFTFRSDLMWESYGGRFGTVIGTPQAYVRFEKGPTVEQLEPYLLLVRDEGARLLRNGIAPRIDDPLNQARLLLDWASDRVLEPHGIWLGGSITAELGLSSHSDARALEGFLRAELRVPRLSDLVGGGLEAIGLKFNPAVPGPAPNVHGVRGRCGENPSVLDVRPTPAPARGASASSTPGEAAAEYDVAGPSGPYVASVYTPQTSDHPCITLVNGFSLGQLVNRLDPDRRELLPYLHGILTGTFGPLGLPIGSYHPPMGVETSPAPAAAAVALGNPVRTGDVTLRLSVPREDLVEVGIYDIAGRRVRLLARRAFIVGAHDLVWDRRSDSGEAVAPGVYLLRVRMGSGAFTTRSRVVVLR